MKHPKPEQLQPGKEYHIRLTDGSWTRGKFLYTTNGNFYSNRHHFKFENIKTGRTIEIKSCQRICFTSDAEVL